MALFDKKKEILTLEHIEEDLIHSAKTPREMSKDEYTKLRAVAIIISVLLVIVWFINYEVGLYCFMGVVAVNFVAIIVELGLRRRKKRISVDDYEVSTEVLANTVEEAYRQDRGRRRSRTVNNYTLRFENGRSWRIPETNYEWAEEHKMSDFSIYRSAHRGDTFIVVSHKETGEIAMAYDTEFFEYKKTTA